MDSTHNSQTDASTNWMLLQRRPLDVSSRVDSHLGENADSPIRSSATSPQSSKRLIRQLRRIVVTIAGITTAKTIASNKLEVFDLVVYGQHI